MLKEILSISGKPGLFQLISQGKNMFIAESLIDHKRVPVYARDKVVSLNDISIYTDDEDVPLIDILKTIKEKENGNPININPSMQAQELRKYFETILPNFDKDRVYPTDIKKVMNWYNLLINNNMSNFERKVAEEKLEEASEESKEKES